MSPATAALTLA